MTQSLFLSVQLIHTFNKHTYLYFTLLYALIQEIMFADHSMKRKAPMSDAELEAKEKLNDPVTEAEEEGKARLRVTILMVRSQMRAKDETHRVELKLQRIASQFSMLKKMMDQEQVIMEAKRKRLANKEKIAEEELRRITVPCID